MTNKYWVTVFIATGKATLFFTLLSFVFPNALAVRDLYMFLCVFVPNNLFEYVTLELKLFSKSLSVRRAIIVSFCVINGGLELILFDYLHLGWDRTMLVFAACSLIGVALAVFIYYIQDKTQSKRLEEINRLLAKQRKTEDV